MSIAVATLESMSFAELNKLQSRIAPLLAKRHTEDVAKACAEVAEKVSRATAEYSKPTMPAVVIAAAGNGKSHKAKPARKLAKRAPIVAAYRDPENPTRTWSGKGPAPRWMKESGKPKEYFLAKPAL